MSAQIIKAKAPDGINLGPAIKKEVHDAKLQARQIISTAHMDALRLADNAQKDRESAMAAGRKEGYEAGLAEWNNILLDSNRRRDTLLENAEPEIVRLAVRVAEKIIGRELITAPETIVSIVKEALKSARRERKFVLHVHPEHEAVVRERIAQLRSFSDDLQELRVFSDSEMSQGGCLIESEIGVVDARLETQLAVLEQALLRRARR